MTFRSQDRESSFQSTITQNDDMIRTRAMEHKSRTFNPINHEGPPRLADLRPIPPKQSKLIRSYDFLSNLTHESHENSPFFFSDDYHIENHSKHAAKHASKVSLKGDPRQLPYNIINNRYKENHSEKFLQENQQLNQRLLDLYMKRNEYNIINQQFSSELNEKKHLMNEMNETRSKMRLKSNLPPSLSISEGNLYNIINNEMKSSHDNQVTEQTCFASQAIVERSLNRVRKHKIMEEKQIQLGDQIAYENEKRSIGRINYERWRQQMERGYDMIKGDTVSASSVPSPVPSAPLTSWNRLTADSSLNRSTTKSIKTSTPPDLSGRHTNRNLSSGRGELKTNRSVPSLNLERTTSITPSGLDSPMVNITTQSGQFQSVRTGGFGSSNR